MSGGARLGRRRPPAAAAAVGAMRCGGGHGASCGGDWGSTHGRGAKRARGLAHPLLVRTRARRSKGDGDYEICNDFIIDDWLRQKLKVGSARLAAGHCLPAAAAAALAGPALVCVYACTHTCACVRPATRPAPPRHATRHAPATRPAPPVQATEEELLAERGCVSHLIGMSGGACAIKGAPDTTVPGEK